MELGCFLAGLMLSIASRDHHRRHRIVEAGAGAHHNAVVGGHHKVGRRQTSLSNRLKLPFLHVGAAAP